MTFWHYVNSGINAYNFHEEDLCCNLSSEKNEVRRTVVWEAEACWFKLATYPRKLKVLWAESDLPVNHINVNRCDKIELKFWLNLDRFGHFCYYDHLSQQPCQQNTLCCSGCLKHSFSEWKQLKVSSVFFHIINLIHKRSNKLHILFVFCFVLFLICKALWVSAGVKTEEETEEEHRILTTF